jgi:hypothetical protein
LEYVDFKIINESWNWYKLSDTCLLKLKLILVNVLYDGLDAHGDPKFSLQINPVIGIVPSSKEVVQSAKEDISFDPIEESWNEYTIDNGFILRIKPIISQINRLSSVNEVTGTPDYGINVHPMVKISKI